MSIVMKAWFRAIAAAFRSEAGAQTVAGLSILALSIYTGMWYFARVWLLTNITLGYTIPKPTMIGALRWITYINVSPYSNRIIIST